MQVRKATMRDIPQMLALINGYAGQAIMLPRTEFELAESIHDFLACEIDLENSGAGRCTTTLRPPERSGRWPFPQNPKQPGLIARL